MNHGLDVKQNYKTFRKIGENISELQLGKEFSDLSPKTLSIKERVDKLDLIKI